MKMKKIMVILGVLVWFGCIYWLFFSDAYYRSQSDWNMIYNNKPISSSSSSPSSSPSECVSKSESKFKSCLNSIPGNASETDMNYCLDLHEAREYDCRH